MQHYHPIWEGTLFPRIFCLLLIIIVSFVVGLKAFP
jgi:hypothetical protein